MLFMQVFRTTSCLYYHHLLNPSYPPYWFEMSLLSYIKFPYKFASVSGILFCYICLLHCSIIICFTIWQANSPQILKVITFSDFFFSWLFLLSSFFQMNFGVMLSRFINWNFFIRITSTISQNWLLRRIQENIFCGFSSSFLSSTKTFQGFVCFCKIHFYVFFSFCEVIPPPFCLYSYS